MYDVKASVSARRERGWHSWRFGEDLWFMAYKHDSGVYIVKTVYAMIVVRWRGVLML